ncbi:hypothetical protein O9H85_14280 [Paenibacillus filicis]|uniref:Restriction endonuclease subunit S n=1 Tax=Paenibacillus gyeongsangnamensis TaxID=3388067 RepID=A0ABT4QA84_9BACL|nr:hypothetical protein [Paenibacillus filicis]MCZ8513580.1 hypothetical protein [Paenibacillus filicis]
MSRNETYHRMLMAASHFQLNIALILEAKAVEAARSCQWICQHLSGVHFEDHGEQLKKTIEIHDQLIEVIDGMTKMEQALAKNIQIILGSQEEESGAGQGGDQFGTLFPFGGENNQ